MKINKAKFKRTLRLSEVDCRCVQCTIREYDIPINANLEIADLETYFWGNKFFIVNNLIDSFFNDI